MTGTSKFWMRSRLIVDRSLQFNLITRMVMFVLFVFCVIGAVLFSPMVRKVEYDAAFTFKFSPREGTKAADMVDDVPVDEKNARLAELNALVKRIADQKNGKLVGRTLPVVLEHVEDPIEGVLKGRTRTNKTVLVRAPLTSTGTTRDVKITSARGLVLQGELVSSAECAARA